MTDEHIKRYMETVIDELRAIKKLLVEHTTKPDAFAEPVGKTIINDELSKRVATFECPECGEPMKLRKRRSDGQPFMGCSNYPDCTGLRDIYGKARDNISQRTFDDEDECPF